MNKEALAARLRATFLGELEEQVRVLNADLLALEAAPGDAERLRSVFRIVHTLKGAARAAGVPSVEKVCHALETRFAEVRDGGAALDGRDFARLFEAADVLAAASVRLHSGADLTEASSSPPEPGKAGPTSGETPAPAQAATPRTVAGRPSGPVPVPVSPDRAAPPDRADRAVRVAAARLDSLLAAAGELTMVGSRFASRPADVEALRLFASTWMGEWRRERGKLRRALTRAGVPDAAASFAWMDEYLRRLVHDTERLASRLAADNRVLSQVTERLGDQVRYIRLRPFGDAYEALPRAVRDMAVELGKDISVSLDGGEVRADREVLDVVRDALLHLIRNAADHGIEPPAERQRVGKPRSGRIRIAARVRGDRIVVTVADDGRGLDVEGIRARLRERGAPDAVAPADIARVLLSGGLSTRREAGMISGRGVGLDAVRDGLARVHGHLEVEWTAGAGTTFTLVCPPSLATVRALLVAQGTHVVAFPCANVERVSRISAGALRRVAGHDVMMTGRDAAAADSVPVVSLAELLGAPTNDAANGDLLTVVTLATLTAGQQRRLGVAVEWALEEREIVLRPLRTGRKRLPLVSGAAPLGTGQLALLLDAAAVVAAGLDRPAAAPRPRAAERPQRRLLVADDSMTIRTLEQGMLEAAGYEVTTAVDGAQAWRLLQERPYDLIVSDIEMPRMDGIALCEAIRRSPAHARLPVVLVTALEAPEQRARGLEAGADAYLAKSGFDQQTLLDTIRQLLG